MSLHGCPDLADHLTVNGAPHIRTRYVVVCRYEVLQLQAQVLESLVETGVIIHELSKCSNPELQLNGGVEGVDMQSIQNHA